MDKPTRGLEVYLVGGAVRDQLLGHPWHERDWVVVGATPEQMLARGFRSVGKDFPVFLHPDTHEEYALARTERKSGHGYTGFSVHAAPDVTLEDDLRRRDLTINAIAKTPEGRHVDPYGGTRDIDARVLRHVSQAFAEDPLRVLRAARFLARYSQYGFSVAPETEALMRQMVSSGELDHLVAERVWKETEKALNERHPEAYFELLARTGALAVVMPLLSEAVLSVGVIRLTAYLTALDNTEERVGTEGVTQAQAVWALLLSPLAEDATEALCRALKAPNEYRQLARQLAVLIALWPANGPQTAEQVLAGFDRLDVWRHPARLSDMLPLLPFCGINVDAEQLQLMANAARAISPQVLMAEGYQGAALGCAIAEKRRQLVTDALR